MRFTKTALLLVLSLSLSACFNENEEHSVVLGNVSLGDQLIDLKKAHDAGAINDTEYREMRESLVNLIADQDFEVDDDDDDDDDKKTSKKKSKNGDGDDNEEEDGFSWL